jgi:type I restriction enzyme M protein
MVTFTSQLKAKFEESDKLEGEIRKNLAGLGYEV